MAEKKSRSANSASPVAPASAENEPPKHAGEEWDAPAAWGLVPSLAVAGLNVVGGLSRDHYDRLVPEAWSGAALLPSAESALILGSGGMAFFRSAMRIRSSGPHPLDEFCEAQVALAADVLEARGWRTTRHFYWERKGGGPASAGEFADFVTLAREAGLGATSRLGLLLHRHYGPWFAIRGLLLSERPFSPTRIESLSAASSEGPCPRCDAPCQSACPGRAIGRDQFSGKDCLSARETLPACRESCAARIACPVGSDYRYDPDVLAYHMRAPFRGEI